MTLTFLSNSSFFVSEKACFEITGNLLLYLKFHSCLRSIQLCFQYNHLFSKFNRSIHKSLNKFILNLCFQFNLSLFSSLKFFKFRISFSTRVKINLFSDINSIENYCFMVNERFADKQHQMQETCNNCFGLKQCNMIFPQEKIDHFDTCYLNIIK